MKEMTSSPYMIQSRSNMCQVLLEVGKYLYSASKKAIQI